MSDITIRADKPREDDEKYCVACGADEKTDPQLTGGFIPFLSITTQLSGQAPATWRYLCAGCLTMVLRACRIGWAGQVAQLSVKNPYLGEPVG